ncbi:Uncharacterised protein [Mycobacteroides abscessus]|nr:Uncharacterised protein [Mycobacteroides abscessus]CPW84782.1 Uncharacterised protein [Mycobacteroides abscessus]SKU88460.1 Uncharacterised protein [Mycobacteroides abscessus subsp. massiliense]SKU96545.1 Uncharacterised protein [Mycobacteroides abscessus subsp. massiliense]
MVPGNPSDKFDNLSLSAARVVVVSRHVPAESSWDGARDQPVGTPPSAHIVPSGGLTHRSVQGSKDVVAHSVPDTLMSHTLRPTICQKTRRNLECCRYSLGIIQHHNVILAGETA